MNAIRAIAAAYLVLGIAGCASNPPAVVALPAPATPVRQSQQNDPASIVLRPVVLPGYLDGYAVVVGRQSHTLVMAEGAEWAERPRDAVTRVLRDALSQRLRASHVLLRGEHRAADAELVIEFLKLDPSHDALELDARWSFVCTSRRRTGSAGRTHLQVPLAPATPSAVAAATVEALSQFADLLAARTWCNEQSREQDRTTPPLSGRPSS